MLRLRPLRLRFHVTISLLVLVVVVATAGLALVLVLHESWKAARETAQLHFTQLSDGVRDRVDVLFGGVETQVAILSGQPQLVAAITADGREHPAFRLFAETLAAMDGLYSVYVAHAEGDFLQLIAPRGEAAILEAHQAPAETALIVRTIAGVGAERRQTWLFIDGGGTVLRRDEDSVFDYDPRQRQWFLSARGGDATVLSEPYLFHSLKAPGVTASRRLAGGGVVGADLTLRQLQDFLDRQRVSDHGGIVVFDGQGRLMAMTGAGLPRPPPMSQISALPGYPFDLVLAGGDDPLAIRQRQDGAAIAVRRAQLRGDNGTTLQVAVFAPESDFTGRIDRMQRHIFAVGLTLSAIGLALAWWLARQIVWPVAQLAADAERARGWDFGGSVAGRSFIAEIGTLAHGFSLIKRSLVETLEQNPVGIVICTPDGRIEYANKAYLAAVDVGGLGMVVGEPLHLWAEAEGAATDYPHLWRAAGHGGACRGEFLNRRGDGGMFWESVVIAPVCDDDGRLAHFIGVHQDISERKAHQDELGRLVAYLSDANAELERFAYVASHDLREPLRTVSTFIQLLRKRFGGQLGAEANEYIDFAVQGAQRMDDLVNDLLAYSRVSSPGTAFVTVDSRRACEAAVQNLHDSLREAGADVRVGGLPMVVGEPVQLMQLFQNLIGNAVKFRVEGRAPVVRVDYHGVDQGSHLFSVADNGIGIEATEQDVFEVFRRLHGQSRYPGTGIGLAICKRVVQRHGGRIWYQPNPGGGTVFHFTLAVDGGVSAEDQASVAGRRRPG